MMTHETPQTVASSPLVRRHFCPTCKGQGSIITGHYKDCAVLTECPECKGRGVKAYRTLRYLEEIREGDEVDSCRDPMRDDPVWVPATNIGDFAPDPAYPAHRIYRRKIAPLEVTP